MSHSKRWVRSWRQASFLGGAVASILLGGCSLLFESGSTSADGGLRDDSGVTIDAGTAGDSGIGEDGGSPVVDAATVNPDAELGDGGNPLPLVTVTFTVKCPTKSDPSLACICQLTSSPDVVLSTTVSMGNVTCTLDVQSGSSVEFRATTTKQGTNGATQCQSFTWTPSNIDDVCIAPSICTSTITTGIQVDASCADPNFFGADI